ncbi:MAG: hypothetical protein LC126_27170 [Bryobacterales bacterium]|nr:hypothetical protein [Bryobacterales bacterium]
MVIAAGKSSLPSAARNLARSLLEACDSVRPWQYLGKTVLKLILRDTEEQVCGRECGVKILVKQFAGIFVGICLLGGNALNQRHDPGGVLILPWRFKRC